MLAALALSSSSVGAPVESSGDVTPEAAVERATKCGFDPVTIRYEDELQSHVLTVATARTATDSQLACLDRSVSWGYFVELAPDVQPRFDAIRGARASAIMAQQARNWLAERKLLSRVPNYAPGATDEAAFTREVETLCGPKATGAFQSQYGFHTLNPDWIKKVGLSVKVEDTDVLSCLMNVTTLAGFEVGFIGNEAYAPEE